MFGRKKKVELVVEYEALTVLKDELGALLESGHKVTIDTIIATEKLKVANRELNLTLGKIEAARRK